MIYYLFAMIFYLEVLGGLLRDAAPEVELVDLAVLVPHGRLVVHDELAPRAVVAAVARRATARHHAARALQLHQYTSVMPICRVAQSKRASANAIS